jgi:hypothetical protein
MWTLIADSDSRQQQQPPAPAAAQTQIIQNTTKSSLLYYVLYVFVLCIVLCIMYFRSLPPTPTLRAHISNTQLLRMVLRDGCVENRGTHIVTSRFRQLVRYARPPPSTVVCRERF